MQAMALGLTADWFVESMTFILFCISELRVKVFTY